MERFALVGLTTCQSIFMTSPVAILQTTRAVYKGRFQKKISLAALLVRRHKLRQGEARVRGGHPEGLEDHRYLVGHWANVHQ